MFSRKTNLLKPSIQNIRFGFRCTETVNARLLSKVLLSGHSPLVEHCLREQKIARDVGVSTLLSRKEITRYPSLDGKSF